MSKSRITWPKALAAAALALSVLTACGSGGSNTSGSGGSSSASNGKKITVGYILAAPVAALQAIGDGVKKEAQSLGMTYTQLNANFSADQQISAMNALEARNVDVIISAPLVPASFFQAAQAAANKGIKVLTYNKAGDGVSYAVTNPDTDEANKIVGVLADHLKSESKPCAIGIIEGQPTAPPLKARDDGFEAGAQAAGCQVLASQVATTTTAAQGSTIANGWKTRFGSSMTGIVVINDDVAVGVLPTRSGDFSPEVVSLNGTPAAVKAVQDGTMYADAGLENAVMGESLAYAAYQLMNGKKVPATASSPYFLITKATAAQFNQKYADSTVLAAKPGKISFKEENGATTLVYNP